MVSPAKETPEFGIGDLRLDDRLDLPHQELPSIDELLNAARADHRLVCHAHLIAAALDIGPARAAHLGLPVFPCSDMGVLGVLVSVDEDDGWFGALYRTGAHL